MRTDVLIIGGGLSGLHTLYHLSKRGISCALIEGRSRIGGRIFTVNLQAQGYDPDKPGFDLGPAWFWQGQSRMFAIIEELGLSQDVFVESADGAVVYEDPNGHIQRGLNGGGMAGSYRLNGGVGQIVDGLVKAVPEDLIHTSSQAIKVSLAEDGVITKATGDGVNEWRSQYAVAALPPRVAMSSISFTPDLGAERIKKLNSVATWMAGQAKALVLYDTPFWRHQGLSGNAMSQRGPLQEIHDTSPAVGGPYALFGFVGVPVTYRRGNEAELKLAILQQLTRLFGEQASNPREVILKDWALDPFTATEQDHQPLPGHPNNDSGELAEPAFHQRLLWSGTETAAMQGQNNGYLEGALESSERTLRLLLDKLEN